MAKDPEQLAHQQWLGYVQPVGLVVSIPALLAAQAQVNRNIATEHPAVPGLPKPRQARRAGPRDPRFPHLHPIGLRLGAGRSSGRER